MSNVYLVFGWEAVVLVMLVAVVETKAIYSYQSLNLTYDLLC